MMFTDHHRPVLFAGDLSEWKNLRQLLRKYKKAHPNDEQEMTLY